MGRRKKGLKYTSALARTSREQESTHVILRGFGIPCKHDKAQLPTLTLVKGNHKPMSALHSTTLYIVCPGVHLHEVVPLQPLGLLGTGLPHVSTTLRFKFFPK